MENDNVMTVMSPSIFIIHKPTNRWILTKHNFWFHCPRWNISVEYVHKIWLLPLLIIFEHQTVANILLLFNIGQQMTHWISWLSMLILLPRQVRKRHNALVARSDNFYHNCHEAIICISIWQNILCYETSVPDLTTLQDKSFSEQTLMEMIVEKDGLWGNGKTKYLHYHGNTQCILRNEEYFIEAFTCYRWINWTETTAVVELLVQMNRYDLHHIFKWYARKKRPSLDDKRWRPWVDFLQTLRNAHTNQ